MAGLSDIISLLFSGPAIKTGMNGVNYGPEQSTVNQMGQLANAQTNMNNPLFKNLYGQNMQAGQQNLAQSIAEIERQNRLATASGQSPLLSQETGSGDVFRNLVQGYQGVQNQARTNTFDQLNRGSQAYAGLLNPQAQLAQGQYKNNVLRSGTTQNIGDALQSLFGLNKQNTQSQPSFGGAMPGAGWNGVGALG